MPIMQMLNCEIIQRKCWIVKSSKRRCWIVKSSKRKCWIVKSPKRKCRIVKSPKRKCRIVQMLKPLKLKWRLVEELAFWCRMLLRLFGKKMNRWSYSWWLVIWWPQKQILEILLCELCEVDFPEKWRYFNDAFLCNSAND